MIEVPGWDGNSAHPFPNVKLRIDFRGPDVGTFVFHCHILNHEDLGMMNIIQVVAPSARNGSPGKPVVAAKDAITVPDKPAAPAMEMEMVPSLTKMGGGRE